MLSSLCWWVAGASVYKVAQDLTSHLGRPHGKYNTPLVVLRRWPPYHFRLALVILIHRASHAYTARSHSPHRQENMEGMLIREVKRGPRRVQPQQHDEHEWLPPEALRTEEEEVAAADAEAAWRDMQEQQQQEEEAGHPKVKEPRYTQRLAALVLEYTNGVEQGAWARARTCLDQAVPPPSSSSNEEDAIYALQDMATALLSSLKKRPGWGITTVEEHLVIKGHGGASAAPVMLEVEILSPLRKAVKGAMARRRRGKTVSTPLELEGEGGALVLALAMEEDRGTDSQQQRQQEQQQREQHDSDKDEDDDNLSGDLAHTALVLVTHSPSLCSLHCCALVLAHHLPLSSSSSSTSSSSSSSSPLALDCVIAAFSLLEPTWNVNTTLTELTAGPSFGGGLQGWKSKPELLLPPALLTGGGGGVIMPLRGEDDKRVMEMARGMWTRFRLACHGQEGEQVGEGTKKKALITETTTRSSKKMITLLSPSSPSPSLSPPPPPSSPLIIQLLARMRLAWSTARAAHKEKKAAQRLGRAALALVRSGLRVGEVNGEVLGHLLPLCFALMEEYEREEAQILGYVIWCFAADKATGTELAWFLPIQMQVFQRGLKMLVKQPGVLRLLLFCVTELLRLTLMEQQEKQQQGGGRGGGWRDAVLEDLLAALARASPSSSSNDQSIVFASLEGMHRLLPLYKDGFLLVRYLRALTQVLAFAPLEEGDDAVRVVALRTLLLVLGQCHVVIQQHALETLAQVLRVYLLLERRGGEKQTEEDRMVIRLCREVAGVLREGCKGQARQGLEAFVQGLGEEGSYSTELNGIWPRESGRGIVEEGE